MDALPATYRSVFVHRAVEQLSTSETAECLELSNPLRPKLSWTSSGESASRPLARKPPAFYALEFRAVPAIQNKCEVGHPERILQQ